MEDRQVSESLENSVIGAAEEEEEEAGHVEFEFSLRDYYDYCSVVQFLLGGLVILSDSNDAIFQSVLPHCVGCVSTENQS